MQSAAISTSALDLQLLLRGSEPEGLGRADQVSYQIETAILMGILTEGDRLPTEWSEDPSGHGSSRTDLAQRPG
jgi:GntR family transcriptional regulator, transcriptional repressor for pyruvate dehydrogenase complex